MQRRPEGLAPAHRLVIGLWLAAAAALPVAALEVPARLTVLPEADPAAGPSVRVLQEDARGVSLEFALPALDVASLDVGGQACQVLTIEGGGLAGEPGEPMLPTFSRWIQVPDRAGVRLDAVEFETLELSGYRPAPAPAEGTGEIAFDAAAYARAGYGDAERVRIGDPALLRGLRVVPVTFRPVRFDPSRGTLEVAGRVEVRVAFDGVDLRNAAGPATRPVPASFDRICRNLVANYQGPRGGQTVAVGSYVLVCPNDPAVVAALQPLVEWRTRRGYEVHLATTAETGTTKENIKAWLQNAYDTWSNPPEHITLVGDANGAIAIPHWSEQYSGYQGETDHPYVQLAGSDILADAHIGRISVESVDRLTLYVNKIVGYESTPYLADTTWYTRACLVGDPYQSGHSCVLIMQWMKERLRQKGYTEIDTVFSGNFVSRMTTMLNRGDTAFAYRGIQGMSGFGTGNISTLTNGWKMPFAVNLTCDTGSFAHSTSRSEAWIRAGLPPDVPTGGIASIGTATLGTDTRHNNCMMAGIWRGVLWEDLFHFGATLTRGKYELYVNYALQDYNGMCTFTCWNNLIGDSAGELWTGVPRAMTVEYPDTIPQGANAVTVTARDGGSPVAGAIVCLWKGSETFVVGETDASGAVELPVSTPSAGAMKLTVTGHDRRPCLATIQVASPERFVGYAAHLLDDDSQGGSSGNGNGQLNPTERVELPVQVRNFGTIPATAVSGILSTDDPYVTILEAETSFGDIAAGTTAWGADGFLLELAADAPHGHRVDLGLDLASGSDRWRSMIQIPVCAAAFAYAAHTLYGAGPQLDPGETAQLSVRLRNQGGAAGTGITGTLLTADPWITVTDASGSFGTILAGSTGENVSDRFGLRARGDCLPGHLASLRLALRFSGGALDTVDFALPVGTAATTDPTGPDRYGYYAFDNTDTAYPQAPVYDWLEIDPTRGGPGIFAGVHDYGEGQDDSRTVDLPFPFRYYGETFTRATICSNGWIAMGSTYLTLYRNWNIPGAEAPAWMIAPMWDDLYEYQDNKVYHWFDAAGHRYVVQWSRLTNWNGWGTENFEVILYDPAYHPTVTGDGVIVFQYDMFNNTDWEQHYCTVGIENGDRDDGLMYSYYNLYSAGAAPIASGRAIKFTPLEAADPAALPEGGAPPLRLALHAIEPNPLTGLAPSATLRFDLPRAAAVRLGLVDVGGRVVRTLVDGHLTAGRHAVAWEADRAGSGVYFLVLQADGEQVTRRVLRVR